MLTGWKLGLINFINNFQILHKSLLNLFFRKEDSYYNVTQKWMKFFMMEKIIVVQFETLFTFEEYNSKVNKQVDNELYHIIIMQYSLIILVIPNISLTAGWDVITF